MKKTLTALAVTGLIFSTSCMKTYNCECITTYYDSSVNDPSSGNETISFEVKGASKKKLQTACAAGNANNMADTTFGMGSITDCNVK